MEAEAYKHFGGRIEFGAQGRGQTIVRQHNTTGIKEHSQPLAFFLLLFWPLALLQDILVWSNGYADTRGKEAPDSYMGLQALCPL